MKKDVREQVIDLQKAFLQAGIAIESGLDSGLVKCGLLVERNAKLILTDEQHVDTGRLRASITTRLVGGKRYRSAQTGTNVQYAADVEFGSGPKHVPIDALKAWAKRKGLGEEAAYPIQQQIEKYGTKPHPFLLPGLKASQGRFQSIVAAEVKKGLQEGAK